MRFHAPTALSEGQFDRLEAARKVARNGEPNLDTHMEPESTKPNPEEPPKQSPLARYAVWSGVATVVVPLLWAMLTSALGGDAGLAVGWFGVLPVILFVPIGIVVTLALSIAATARANKPKEDTKPAEPATKNPDDRNV